MGRLEYQALNTGRDHKKLVLRGAGLDASETDLGN